MNQNNIDKDPLILHRATLKHGFFVMRENFTLKGKDKGFALIATITLMVLLALLSVGLLTIASSQTRVSQRGIFAAEARAQAKLALEVAIGRLQCELGPDQRISANSGILDTNPNSEQIDGVGNPYILGVWDSWSIWANRKNSQGVALADTYSKGRKELFRSWLISSAQERNLRDIDSGILDLGQFRNNSGEQKVLLLGEGSLGRQADKDKRIYAGLVQVDDANTAVGPIKGAKSNHRKSIAWWISGENQKVLANQPQSKASSNDSLTVLRETWNTPAPDFTEVNAIKRVLKNLPTIGADDYNRKIRSLITRDTMSLLSEGSGASDAQSLYHDVSFDSFNLLTDVKFGGLKKDINILCSQEKLPDQFRSNSADLGLRPYSTEDGGATIATRPIASWNQLFEWSNIWDTQTIRSGQDASAKLVWKGAVPTTLVACDAEGTDGMMNNRHTYMRQPIILKMYTIVAIGLRNNSKGEVSTQPHAQICVIPIFVMWNPYNVQLEMKGGNGEPWGTYFAPHRLIPLLSSSNAGKIGGEDPGELNDANLEKYYETSLTPYCLRNRNDLGLRSIADYGASFRKKAYFDKGALIREDDESPSFLPGEIRIFALPVSQDYSSSIDGGGNSSIAYRRSALDLKVDAVVLQEGWDTSEKQARSYSNDFQRYLNFSMLEGSGFSDPHYKMRIKLAENKKELKGPHSENSGAITIGQTPPSRVSQFFYTDEYPEGKGDLGSFTLVSGLLDSSQFGKNVETRAQLLAGNPTEEDAKSYAKASPAIFNMNWGTFGPLIDNATIPSTSWLSPDGGDYKTWAQSKGMSANLVRQGRGGIAEGNPIYIAYYGISAKWGKKPAIGTFPAEGNNDFRAKTWQHSSPLFWGSQMVTASDVGRAYSPYQFEFKSGTSGDKISVENILSNDGEEKNSVFGGPGSEQVSCIVAAELPVHPPYSLAGFAGMRLTPGWYEEGDGDKAKIAKRFAYQSGVPGVGIGNAFADPMLPADQIFSHSGITNDPALGDFWDHALMVNDGLWDTWFASSLSSRPSALTGGNKESLKTVIDTALKAVEKEDASGNSSKKGLSNSRLAVTLNGNSSQNISDELMDEKNGWEKVAKYLRLQGGFNVNSTSAIAWKSILEGLKKRSILYSDNGVLNVLPTGDETYFSRQAVASNKLSHVDDFGAAGVNNGMPHGDMTAWSDLRKVDSRGMKNLAESMLKEVKKRGPFLNLAEFINRRLTTGDTGLKGALQEAIDSSGLNSVFDQMADKKIQPDFDYPHKEAAVGSVYTAAPGYLIQSDILAVLGNILTTRDDTFTIRAYGEVSSPSGKDILSRAWCEAVVKRSIEYVDPTNSPETPAVSVNIQTGELKDAGLSKINKAFGRQFLVTSFRWLSPEEV